MSEKHVEKEKAEKRILDGFEKITTHAGQIEQQIEETLNEQNKLISDINESGKSFVSEMSGSLTEIKKNIEAKNIQISDSLSNLRKQLQRSITSIFSLKLFIGATAFVGLSILIGISLENFVGVQNIYTNLLTWGLISLLLLMIFLFMSLKVLRPISEKELSEFEKVYAKSEELVKTIEQRSSEKIPQINRDLSRMENSLHGLSKYSSDTSQILKEGIKRFNPLTKELYATTDKVLSYKQLVNRIVQAMLHYEIPMLPDVIKEMNENMPLSDNVESWEDTCFDVLRDNLQGSYKHVSKDILKLLYYEQTGRMGDLKQTWRGLSPDEINRLSWLLVDLGLLPVGFYNFAEKDVASILSILDVFSLEKAVEIIHRYGGLVSEAKNYLDFLRANGIRPQEITASDVLAIVTKIEADLRTSEFRHIVLRALEKLGIDNCLTTFPTFGEARARSLALLSLPMYFLNNQLYLKDACRMVLEQEDAVLAYYALVRLNEKRAKMGVMSAVALKDVAEKFDLELDEVKKLIPDQFKQEIIVARSELNNGEFISSANRLTLKTLEKLKKELPEEIEKRFAIAQRLRLLFKQKVTIETVERVLDAHSINAYLITFDVDEGNLADIIDMLTGVKEDGKQKYKFYVGGIYTKHSRVGIVTSGKNFDTFSSEFLEDLRATTSRAQQKIKNPKVVIHRLHASKYNFASFEPARSENIPNVEITRDRKKAFELVRELVADEFGTKDIFAIVRYSQISMSEILAGATVYDLTHDVVRITEKEKEIFNVPALIEDICKALDQTNLQDLAITVFRKWSSASEIEKSIVEEILKTAQTKQISIDARKAKEISKSFVATLRDIAEIS
jgi:hypothetical protein